MPQRNAMACYVYAGNFSLGVLKHMDVVGHCEDPQPYGLDVIDMNRDRYWGSMPVHAGPANWPVNKKLDLLFANPPCAAFSNANTRSYGADSYKSDPRCECWYNVMNQVEACQPKVFAVESVCQMYTKAPAMVQEMVEWTQRMGYRPHIFFHNACFMGSCQDRRRLLLIGSKKVFCPEHYESKPAVTVAQRLKGVKPNGQVWAHGWSDKLIPVIQAAEPGERLSKVWERLNPPETRELNAKGNVKGRPSFGLQRLNGDGLCPTIMAYPLAHPSEDRFIHLSEHQALADFPKDYKFPGGTGAYHYCGRGVSSKVGEWLARSVDLTLRAGRSVGKDRRLRVIEALRGAEHQVETTVEIGGPLPPVSVMVRPRSAPPVATVPRKRPAAPKVHQEELDLSAQPASRAARAKRVQQRRVGSDAPLEREERFDRSQLKLSSKGLNCHRDYSAHFFRWSFLRRYVQRHAVILDVGCGQEVPLMHLLTDGVQGKEPKLYVGVDLNPIRKKPQRKNAVIFDEFNFLAKWKVLLDYMGYTHIACLEVLEHMHKKDGRTMLKNIAALMSRDTLLFLSTPVFNGRAARAHLHEYTVPELEKMLVDTGFEVVNRFGTFMNVTAGVKKQLSKEHREVMDDLSAYYDNDALSCFFAPMYPDLARNNLWVLRLRRSS